MRRMLILLGFAAIALPATWNPVNAQQTGIQIFSFTGQGHPLRNINQLLFRLSEDTALTTIVVEHSLDNITFEPIGEVAPINNSGHYADYTYWHVNPPAGVNYYQLRFLFSHGGEQLSYSIRVMTGGPPIYSYPRPGGFKLQGDSGNPWVKGAILDMSGRQILSFTGNEVDIESLPSGIYVVRALDAYGWQASLFTKATE